MAAALLMAKRLKSNSTVAGLFEEWDCAMEERQLSPADTLVLYTDGATESFSQAGEEFGEERLLHALLQHRELCPEELVGAITNQVRQFSSHEQADDITLIAAQCR